MPVVTDIFSLINHRIPQKDGNYENYGCAGIGNFDADAKTLGRPVDDVDKALNTRKHCIRCIKKDLGLGYQPYNYHENNNHCTDAAGTTDRAFCECDLEFVETVMGLETPNSNFDTSQCIPITTRNKGECCKSSLGLYKWYNPLRSCCTDGIVVANGGC